jgi:hypothetical protein
MAARARSWAKFKTVHRYRRQAEENDMKYLLLATTALMLGMAPASAAEKHGRGIYNQRDDMVTARSDVRAAARVPAEPTAVTAAAGENVGWSFTIKFMRHSFDTGYSYMHPTVYGMYASQEECERVRAERINQLESDPRNPTAPITRPIREWTREAVDLNSDGQNEASAKSGDKDDKSHGRKETQRQGGVAHSFRPENCVAQVYVDVDARSAPRPQPQQPPLEKPQEAEQVPLPPMKIIPKEPKVSSR